MSTTPTSTAGLDQERLLLEVTRDLQEADMRQASEARYALKDVDVAAMTRLVDDLEAAHRQLLRDPDPEHTSQLPQGLPGPQGADLAHLQRLRAVLQGMDLTPLLQFQAARRSLQDLDPHGFGTLMRNARVVSNLHQLRKLLDLDVRGLQELQERLRRLQDVDPQALLDGLARVDARSERDHAASQDMQSEGGPAEPASAAPRRAAA